MAQIENLKIAGYAPEKPPYILVELIFDTDGEAKVICICRPTYKDNKGNLPEDFVVAHVGELKDMENVDQLREFLMRIQAENLRNII